MIIEISGVTRLWVAIVVLIFVLVSVVSVGIILLLFVGTEGFYGFCDHEFGQGFGWGFVDCR